MTFRLYFYKGTRPGIPGLYNRLVRAQDCGPYSHVEMRFSNGWSASSSFEDKGVRYKWIDYDDSNWDYIDLPKDWEKRARQWFDDHRGEKYDVMGNVHLAIGFFNEERNRKFCSEAIGAALGVDEAWRLTPNTLCVVIERLVDEHLQTLIRENHNVA